MSMVSSKNSQFSHRSLKQAAFSAFSLSGAGAMYTGSSQVFIDMKLVILLV